MLNDISNIVKITCINLVCVTDIQIFFKIIKSI